MWWFVRITIYNIPNISLTKVVEMVDWESLHCMLISVALEQYVVQESDSSFDC